MQNEGYDSSIYPDCYAGEPALEIEQWLKGENKEAVRKNITTMENTWVTTELTFEKKEEEKSVSNLTKVIFFNLGR